jgi:hypothetical protein
VGLRKIHNLNAAWLLRPLATSQRARLMPVVICEECRQSAKITVTGGEVAYKFNLSRCTQKNRPSTPAERFVDSTRCPRLEAVISTARQRGEI